MLTQEEKLEIVKSYQVNRDGSVFSRRTGKIMIGCLHGGYRRLKIRLDNKKMNIGIHRMVAMHYLDNPNNCPQVNHKNGIKNDNRVENLEWCSAEENQEHYKSFVKRGEHTKLAILKDCDIIDIRSRILMGDGFARIFKDYERRISWDNFRDVCRGKVWKHIELDITNGFYNI